jgi:large repetitive protein
VVLAEQRHQILRSQSPFSFEDLTEQDRGEHSIDAIGRVLFSVFWQLEAAMKRIHTAGCMTANGTGLMPIVLLAVIFFTGPISMLGADILFLGDYSPAAGSWNSTEDGVIGNTGVGAVTITSGTLSSKNGYLGYSATGSGTATVDGTGSAWNNSLGFYVGGSGSGTLNINHGGAASNIRCEIGSESGSTGTVSVDGSGSTLTSSNYLYVGNLGNGTLNIFNGSTISVASTTEVGRSSTGTINFGTNGGTLTTRSLFVAPSQLMGTGTITTNGLVSDIDLEFDSAHGLSQVRTIDQSGQNITVNLNMNNTSDLGSLGAGHIGSGSLKIRDGITVNSHGGYIGNRPGSTGVATVDGTGSKWINSGHLSVGHRGGGTLNITRGAAVSNTTGYIGFSLGSTGIVNVDGANSSWTNSVLRVGSEGNGTLNISNGGAVTVNGITAVALFTGPSGTIHFGDGGGTLTTQSLWASPTQLTGAGTIITRGMLSDMDLVFDSTRGLNQTLTFNNPPIQNIAINLINSVQTFS